MSEIWADTTLGAVADISIGKTPPRNDPQYWTESLDHPFCTIADMAGFSINPTREGVTALAIAEKKAKGVPAGSLLMSFKLSIGRVGFASREIFPNEAIAWIEPKSDDLDKTYLAHWLSAQDLTAGSGRAVKGSTLNGPSLRAIRVSVPPLAVQRRIVDLMAHLDQHIATLRAECRALDALWWALTRELQEQIEAAPRLPLGEIADISGGLTKNKNTLLNGDPVSVPYLRVANVHRRFLDLTNLATIETTMDVVDRLKLIPGDVLMNEGGDKDKLARGTVWRGEVPVCIHQNHVFRVRITDDRLDPEFVSAWSNSYGQKWFETFGTQTTGIASVSKSTLSKFPVPVIPRSRQSEWAEALRAIDLHLKQVTSTVDALNRVRAAALRSLLSGTFSIPVPYDSLLDGAA